MNRRQFFSVVARFPAIEGKTWNHPVLAGDVLLVRNGQAMAAFRLPSRAADGGCLRGHQGAGRQALEADGRAMASWARGRS
jgi:hypothetical protein